ncbi:MAG: hypothetical protein LC128_11650 [Chitinophagales bacterium]|nr:hypothetical protein [Chitinophagales bacterium]
MKWKAILILFLILISLIPVYWLNKYSQKIIQPQKSLARLLLYLFSGVAFVFLYTFLLVLAIKMMFRGA